jgi:ribonucleoside-diphosphate reductase alpha chain
MGHVKMMGAIQPFISGAISKTVNVPNEATVEDIFDTYVESWKQGVKAIAIYRDGSKAVQPLSTSSEKKDESVTNAPAQPVRKRLPDTRPSVTHKFSIEGHEGYINVGLYPETKAPGEIFITMAKEGSTLSGMMDAFATSISIGLQYGMPLRDYVSKFSHMRFEPMGRTENREIPVAQSIVDYIFRWLASQFLEEQDKRDLGILTEAERKRLAEQYGAVQTQFVVAPVEAPALPAPSTGLRAGIAGGSVEADALPVASLTPGVETPSMRQAGNGHAEYRGPRVQADASACANCGWIMSRSGTCYRCENCGSTSGCS